MVCVCVCVCVLVCVRFHDPFAVCTSSSPSVKAGLAGTKGRRKRIVFQLSNSDSSESEDDDRCVLYIRMYMYIHVSLGATLSQYEAFLM